jgi:lysine-specific permease
MTFAFVGPAGLLIAYAIIGSVAYFVALQLGEMSAYIPVSTKNNK